MERKILHISSCREAVVEEFSSMIRNLGRRCQSALWGKAFNSDEDVKAILYLDSGGRGSLDMMIKGMDADTVEFLFLSEDAEKGCLLLSELLIPAYINGDYFYKSREKASETQGNRIKRLDMEKEGRSFLAINETPFERSKVYSARISEMKRNVTNGIFREDDISELFSETLPDVVICDAFAKSGVMAILKKQIGRPCVIHIMNGEKDVYVPYSALGRGIFVETEDFIKDALAAICLWLADNDELKSGEVLYEAYSPLKRGEELILRTEQRFMKTKENKRSGKDEH